MPIAYAAHVLAAAAELGPMLGGMIPLGWVIPGGASTILGVVVIMILRGNLATRREIVRLEQQCEKWQHTAELALEQNAQLLINARVQAAVMNTLPDVARTPPPTEGVSRS
jgi:hypothetical protein